MPRAQTIVLCGAVVALVSLGAAAVAAGTPTVTVAGKTTIVLHAPRSKGDKVTITGKVTPLASTHRGKVLGEVTLYLLGKHSDEQVSSLTHPSRSGTFTLASVSAVAKGTHTFMVQYNPVAPWSVAQKTFRFTVGR